MVLIRLEEGERLEAIDQLGSVLRHSKCLQQLLEDQSCREDLICPQECLTTSTSRRRASDQTLVSTSRLTACEPVQLCNRTKRPTQAFQKALRPASNLCGR